MVRYIRSIVRLNKALVFHRNKFCTSIFFQKREFVILLRFLYMKIIKHVLLAGAFGLTALTGCENSTYFQKVVVKPADDLQSIRVSLVFTDALKSDWIGAFGLKDYGFLFVNPYTPKTPFEIGFDLNTAIVNDQDYIKLEPVTVFPNGNPLGIDGPLVQIKSATPINDKVDVYGYVDVLEKSWLGLSVIFLSADLDKVPNDLSFTTQFLRNDAGAPGVIASIYGRSVSEDGAVTKPGGLTVLANVRQLMTELQSGKETIELYPAKH
jgi:hypothetical protein